MRLVDIMSSLHLTSYAEIGLVMFMAAFVCVAVELFVARGSELWSTASRLPLEPDQHHEEDGARGNVLDGGSDHATRDA